MCINGDFILKSDFEIREIRKEDEHGDVDLFIPIGHRTVNLFIPFIDEDKMSRIQLCEVKNIVIRFNTKEGNNRCSIHFLKNIDLLSHLLNFELDYKNYEIIIKQEEYSVSFILVGKQNQ
ncbi:MAG: hypothetical protein ACOX0L_10595 [Natronincolaceae bacterium]|jgi:hypothetical protein|nr:hypothetical protein [Bacillota bacterium]NLK90163.1 hypothetical protein [Clostridiales bacterium]